jgi:hypothetical protein
MIAAVKSQVLAAGAVVQIAVHPVIVHLVTVVLVQIGNIIKEE